MATTDTAPELLPVMPHWTGRARCRDSDPDLFHGRGQNHNTAKWVCEKLCPVKDECLTEGERRKNTFEHAQTWGGVLFPRARLPKSPGHRLRIQVDHRTKNRTECPGCGRMVGVVGRYYVTHQTDTNGMHCPASKTLFSLLLLDAELVIMRRVIAGETRSALRPKRSYTDRLKRDKLIALNDAGTYDMTPDGWKAIRDTEEKQAHDRADDHRQAEESQPAPDRSPGREGRTEHPVRGLQELEPASAR